MKRVSLIGALSVGLVGLLAVFAFANGAGPAVTPEAVEPTAPPPSPAVGAGPTTTYSTNQLIPLTVAEAWQLSGRNDRNFAQMVQQLAELSARNRGITLPDTREAGSELGRMIRQKAEANPNQLLYEVVDSSIVEYRAKQSPGAPVGAGPVVPMYSANQLMPLTVAQAWRLSGQNYDVMARMVRTLVEVSAERRGIDIQDTKVAGTQLGAIIRRRAEADPNQLLYVVVDDAVVEYAAQPQSTTPQQ